MQTGAMSAMFINLKESLEHTGITVDPQILVEC